jgi:hypothetical protein
MYLPSGNRLLEGSSLSFLNGENSEGLSFSIEPSVKY